MKGFRAPTAGERPKTGTLVNRVLCASAIARGAITSVRVVVAVAKPHSESVREKLVAAGFPFRYPDSGAEPVPSLVVTGEDHEPPQGFVPLEEANGATVYVFGRQGELIASASSGWSTSVTAAKDSAAVSVYPQIESLLHGT